MLALHHSIATMPSEPNTSTRYRCFRKVHAECNINRSPCIRLLRMAACREIQGAIRCIAQHQALRHMLALSCLNRIFHGLRLVVICLCHHNVCRPRHREHSKCSQVWVRQLQLLLLSAPQQVAFCCQGLGSVHTPRRLCTIMAWAGYRRTVRRRRPC